MGTPLKGTVTVVPRIVALALPAATIWPSATTTLVMVGRMLRMVGLGLASTLGPATPNKIVRHVSRRALRPLVETVMFLNPANRLFLFTANFLSPQMGDRHLKPCRIVNKIASNFVIFFHLPT